ncbi:MAG TPA: ferritin [Candidatus Bathyarchaeia archaeon]|nr:ferritin [Candidatus Bathyarchaeia archaeon]
MLSKKVETALNDQIQKEIYSSYLYLSMAAQFASMNLNGFAHWMKVQTDEETKHAMKIYEHVNDRNGRVILQQIDAPPSSWKSAKDMFQDAYQHETKVTESINKIVELARTEKDNATEVFLQWFVNEQVEEEASTNNILQKLQVLGDNPSALLMLDAELNKRPP